ncbi:hypothetical protein EYC80_001129 [Monilinia laxa]|uniref:Mannan polymerase complexes MNN9 subunit n=1 Tax=Monilinia laxa TaxID=61186 RepID=A0A5N6K8F1_MONLA|nr:hypothetical protein EYC80_001129 [Monilinia laxa]
MFLLIKVNQSYYKISKYRDFEKGRRQDKRDCCPNLIFFTIRLRTRTGYIYITTSTKSNLSILRNSRIDKCALRTIPKPSIEDNISSSTTEPWAQSGLYGVRTRSLCFADSAASQLRRAGAASNPLSPPTSPFRKQNEATKSGKRIPPPVVHYHMNNVTSTADPLGNREAILILTPLARFYQGYWDNLLKLSYPHELITLAFIIPKNKEGNAATAALQEQVTKTQKSGPEKNRFASIIIERQDFDPPLASQTEAERHKFEHQKARRAAMSRARNSLLFTTLGPSVSWVLWLDSDVVETPPTLIQDLASHDKAIIVPNCFQRYYDAKDKRMAERPYDFNSWQDSDVARKLGESMGPDDILLEGYADMATYRTLMAYLTNDSGDVKTEVPLDGVGGTALMVKAERQKGLPEWQRDWVGTHLVSLITRSTTTTSERCPAHHFPTHLPSH